MDRLNFDKVSQMEGFYPKLYGMLDKLAKEIDWEAAKESNQDVDEFLYEHLVKKVFPEPGIVEIQEDWEPQDDVDRWNVMCFVMGCNIGKVLLGKELEMTTESETSH